MRRVFICYSREDYALVREFCVHLEPWTRNGELDVWMDDELADMAGQDWHGTIREAIGQADAAVVIVSPDLFASEFIDRHEMPLLFAAHASGRLTLLPLFARHSNVGARKYRTPTGTHERTLTEFQGLNAPSDAIADANASERDRRLKECAQRLWTSLDHAVARPRGENDDVPLLTARVIRRNNRELIMRYESRGGELESVHSILPPTLLAVGHTGLAEGAIGDALWEALFGNDQRWRKILLGVLGTEPASPIQYPVRLRLHTDDSLLRSLPWGLTRWSGYTLSSHDWTFEFASGRRTAAVERLETPCAALMLACADFMNAGLRTKAHHLAFKGLLTNLWKRQRDAEPIPLLTDPHVALNTFRSGLVPRLVYIYAPAVDSEHGPCFQFAREHDNVLLSFGQLASAWKRDPPQVVYVNTLGSLAVVPRTDDVALLVHRRQAGDVTPSVWRDAQRWWQHVLGDGADPVRAVYDLGREAWRSTMIQTRFERLSVDVSDYTPRVDRARAFLDRVVQRNAVRGAIDELVRRRRMVCVLASGTPSNMVNLFAMQLTATLRESDGDRLRLHHIHLRFRPDRDAWTVDDLEADFRDQLQLESGQGLESAFERIRRGSARAIPLFLLDWHTYPVHSDHQPPLQRRHLRKWLEFCRDRLAPAVRSNARVVAYVAIETTRERLEGIRDWASVVRAEVRAPDFDFIAPEPLGTVTANDLSHFLEDESNTSCPREYIRELPERIIGSTGGDFEKTVQLLENAEEDYLWPMLIDTLPPAPMKNDDARADLMEL